MQSLEPVTVNVEEGITGQYLEPVTMDGQYLEPVTMDGQLVEKQPNDAVLDALFKSVGNMLPYGSQRRRVHLSKEERAIKRAKLLKKKAKRKIATLSKRANR